MINVLTVRFNNTFCVSAERFQRGRCVYQKTVGLLCASGCEPASVRVVTLRFLLHSSFLLTHDYRRAEQKRLTELSKRTNKDLL